MEFRQRGQRDDRRRRVLTDETPATAPASDAIRRTRRSGALYAPGAAFDLQPRLTQLVPCRPLWVALMAVLALAVVAALHGAHYALVERAGENGTTAWRGGALDLESPTALVRWFRSTALLVAAALAVVVYAVRRHRTDDYRAGYRAWLWIAAVWVLLSVGASTAISADISRAMVMATGWTGPAGGVVWWLAPMVGIVAAVGLRLLLDMRGCWLSAGCLGVAGGCALTVTLGDLFVTSFLPAVVRADLLTAASTLAALAMLVHGRHVLLEAQGIRPGRRKKRSKTEEASAEKSTTGEHRAESVNSAGQNAPPLPASRSFGRVVSDDEDDDDSSEDSDGDPRLSKAERKRLRKLQKEERRQMRRAA